MMTYSAFAPSIGYDPLFDTEERDDCRTGLHLCMTCGTDPDHGDLTDSHCLREFRRRIQSGAPRLARTAHCPRITRTRGATVAAPVRRHSVDADGNTRVAVRQSGALRTIEIDDAKRLRLIS